MSSTLISVDKQSKLIADAQAFIDSVNSFNESTSEESLTGVGSGPLPSNLLNSTHSDYSSGNLLDRPVKNNSTQQPPVGKSAFPEFKFSPTSQYTEPFRADLLTFIEVYYYENKRLPDVHVLHEQFKEHPERPNFLKGWTTVLDGVSDSLINRGIKPYNTVENYIDPKFAWATSLIVNHLDKRTVPAKLKEAGLSTKEWQAFLRRKRHYDYFQSRLDEVFDNDVKNDAKIALAKSIQNGDLQAIKYYNELKNIYRPETQNALQMISIVLTAVMEILAQNVTSEVLNLIAAEIRTSPSVRKIIEIEAK